MQLPDELLYLEEILPSLGTDTEILRFNRPKYPPRGLQQCLGAGQWPRSCPPPPAAPRGTRSALGLPSELLVLFSAPGSLRFPGAPGYCSPRPREKEGRLGRGGGAGVRRPPGQGALVLGSCTRGWVRPIPPEAREPEGCGGRLAPLRPVPARRSPAPATAGQAGSGKIRASRCRAVAPAAAWQPGSLWEGRCDAPSGY